VNDSVSKCDFISVGIIANCIVAIVCSISSPYMYPTVTLRSIWSITLFFRLETEK